MNIYRIVQTGPGEFEAQLDKGLLWHKWRTFNITSTYDEAVATIEAHGSALRYPIVHRNGYVDIYGKFQELRHIDR